MRLYTAFCVVWLMGPAFGATDEPKVVCYYRNSAISGIGYAKMTPSEIDPNLCTHLIYEHVGISKDGEVTVLEPGLDLPDDGGKAGYRTLNALRKRNGTLKTLVATRFNVVNSTTFSEIPADQSLRSKIVRNVVDFLLRHEFDGFNIHWHWEIAGEMDADDVKNFILLLKDLRASFDKHKLILSVTVDGRESLARKLFDIPEFVKLVDLIVLTLKVNNPARTGHLSPLYPLSSEISSDARTLNYNAMVQYWLEEGAPAQKLVLGVQFQGLVYDLKNSTEHGPGSPTIVPDESNFDPNAKSYNEICRLISQGTWTTVWEEEQRVPYSYTEDQWMTYDNAKSIIDKGKYARAMGLGGVAAWSIDQDDHQGYCGMRRRLLNALNCGLRDVGCNSVPRNAGGSLDAKVVCIYLGAASNSIGYERLVPSRIDPNLCTHLIYGLIFIDENGDVTHLDRVSDLPDNGGKAGFQKFNALRKQNAILKTLVSAVIDSQHSASILKTAADESLRLKFARNIVAFLLRHEFNGLDIIWEWPISNGSNPENVENFILLLKELRASFDEQKLILSITLEETEDQAQEVYNIAEIVQYVDLLLLHLRYFSHLDSRTGHYTALYPSARDTSNPNGLNWNASVHHWLKQGVPAEKLIPITNFYGQGFVLQNPAEHEPGSLFVERILVLKRYNEICRIISQGNWTTVWDEAQRVPYSYAGNEWITHENPRSLVEKGKYVQAMGLGGIAGWTIDHDDHRGECGVRNILTKALNCGLRDVGCSSILTTEASTPSNATGQNRFGSVSSLTGGDVSTTPKVDVTIDFTDEAKKICARFNIKYVRHPHDHAKFWICQEIHENEFHAEPFRCGPGLYFDTRRIICKSTDSMEFH